MNSPNSQTAYRWSGYLMIAAVAFLFLSLIALGIEGGLLGRRLYWALTLIGVALVFTLAAYARFGYEIRRNK